MSPMKPTTSTVFAQPARGAKTFMGLTPKALAAAVSAVMGLGLGTSALAASLSVITPDNKTNTTVATTGNTVNVSTTTVSGKTAFNSFSAFNVDAADTVNLKLPTNTTSLVNLVWGNAAVISGQLNSVLSTGAVGGSVYFADTAGVVVNHGAVINVGALSLSAPTSSFMNSLLSNGQVNTTGAAMTSLLQGTEPLADASGTCLVCVSGTINANGAVRIRANAIDITGTGVILVKGTGTDILATAVNVEGQATPTIYQDGNTIRLVADDTASASIADASASATINVSGKLTTTSNQAVTTGASASSWGLVQASAKATATSAFTTAPDDAAASTILTGQFGTAGQLLKDQGSFAQFGLNSAITDANLAASDKLGQMAYVRASAVASVNVNAGAVIKAAGDVALTSSATTKASTAATAESASGAAPVMVGAMYGAVYSKAATTVAGTVTAGGDVAVAASTDNTLDIVADTVAGDQSLATTVAWSQAAVSADAVVTGAISGQSLGVLAHNSNDFKTEASTSTSATTGSVGVAGAVSLQTVSANAQLNASPTIVAGGSGNVTVAAASDTSANSTSAATKTGAESSGTPATSDDETAASNADLSDTLAAKSNKGLNSDGSTSKDALPFHLGAAVAYTDSNNTVNASIGPNVHINTAGDVAVYAALTDAGIHNGASSDATSKAESSDGGSSSASSGTSSGTGSTGGADSGAEKVNLAAAVAYGNYTHDASATIGAGDVISAAHVGVSSNLSMPFDWTFTLGSTLSSVEGMGGSLDDFIAGLSTLKTTAAAGADLITGNLSGYASASSGGNADLSVGGSVNYFAVNNTNHAWIGDGASVTSTAAASSNSSWSTAIDWLASDVTWTDSLSVSATTAVTAFNLVGSITPWKASTDGKDGAVGGAFNYVGYDNDTVALVGSGVTLNSRNTVAVTATSTDTLIALSPISGNGGTASLQGTVAITDVNDVTHASVSASDIITAATLNIAATNPVMIWALSGAVAMSNEASVGLSVGVNSTTTDTVATVGDNSADDLRISGAAAGAQTGGSITVARLVADASSSGESGALSVAGSSAKPADPNAQPSGSTGSTGSTGSSGTSGAAPDAAPGSGLISMIANIKSVTGKLQTGIATVDGLSGALGGSSTMGSGASDVLDQISGAADKADSASESLQTLLSKASTQSADAKDDASSTPPTKPAATPTQSAKFGIAISGAAAVNLAKLGANASLDGANITGTGTGATVIVQGLNQASLTSVAGAAALQRVNGSGTSGALAGAVAYSSVADVTSATINHSNLTNASQVQVQALDGSQQIDAAIGVGVNKSTGTSTTVAGSVSVASSHNTTTAAIQGGSVLTAGNSTGSSLEVTAYDHSRIGVGSGALYSNSSTGSSANVGVGFTYADIDDGTNATLSGHTGNASALDISGYDALTLRALDSSLIAAAAISGGYSGSTSSYSLSGAVVYTDIGNTTAASVIDGLRMSVDGAVAIQASAVAPVASLDALVGSRNAEGFDFTGATLGAPAALSSGNTPGSTGDAAQPTLAITDTGLGSSIIAVAGSFQSGGNNVGLSYVGNNVHNSHTVSIDDASIVATGAMTLAAHDDTRIIGIAVGAAYSSGSFAGVGSATTNIIGNTDAVLIGSAATTGHGATLKAASIDAQASDDSTIYALAGNVAIGKGDAAAGGALTYNDISNTVSAKAGNAAFIVDGSLTLGATESAEIMAGAVAAAGATNGTALTLSFGWNQTADTATASINDGSTVAAGSLAVNATNSADIYALAGGVSIGGDAAVGLAATVADIADNTSATISHVGLNVAAAHGADGSVDVAAAGTGLQYSLAVAGAVGTSGAGVAGSATANTINSNVSANADTLFGLSANVGDTATAAVAQALAVTAQNSASIYSLAGGVGIGESAGVGAAVTVALLGGTTSAHLGDSLLSIADSTTVSATSTMLIESAAVAGAAASSAAISASSATNDISNTIGATVANVGTVNPSDASVTSTNQTSVLASNGATIKTLAGAIAGSSSVAVGAAVAVDHIGTQTTASFQGGSNDLTYEAGQLLVQATTGSATISTIAVGAAGGGDVAAAGSVAVNLLGGSTTASIMGDANVIVNGSLGVLASNNQAINVFAGQAALSGSVGVGIGVVVNDITGSTSATIADSDVTAYGNGSGLSVDSGVATNATTLASGLDITGSNALANSIGTPGNASTTSLGGVATTVHGVAVNATNMQRIDTLGLGASVGGSVAVNGLAGVNIVGGSTTASITDSQVNQADRVASGTGTLGYYSFASDAQQVDVRANSRQYESNFVANIAGSGTVAVNGSVATNVFNAATTAGVTGSTVSSEAGTMVAANSQQWSLAVATGAAISGEVSAAASGAVTIFNANTKATVDGGSLDVGSLGVTANGTSTGAQIVGAVGIGVGTAGIAGAAAVNVDESSTTAQIIDHAAVSSVDAVNVAATSSNTAQALVVGGGVGLFAGVAGGALVNVASNNTTANIGDSAVTASSVAIHALDTQTVNAYSGMLAAGLVGVGGGINLSLLQSSVKAGATGSTLNTSGDVDIAASSTRNVDSTAVAFAGGGVGVSLAASVVVAGSGDIGDNGSDLHSSGQVNLDSLGSLAGSGSGLNGSVSSYGLSQDQLSDAQLQGITHSATYNLASATGSSTAAFGASDGVLATVSGGSVSAGGKVSVGAKVLNSTSNTAGSGAVGAVGVGGALAYTSLNSDVGASVTTGTTVTARNGIAIAATADDGTGGAAAKTSAIAGVGGLVGVGAAVAIADVANTVTATAAGTLNAATSGQGALTVDAKDGSSIIAGNSNPSIVVGGVVVGAVVVDAIRSSDVSASIANSATVGSFASAHVGAVDNGSIQATGVMGAGGVLDAISAVVATASDSSTVTAFIGSDASVQAAATDVAASASPTAGASATGITIGGAGVGLGADVAVASVNATVNAYVDDRARFGSGSLSVLASATPKETASSTGGAGAVLMGANASSATASAGTTVNARIGKNVTLPTGNVSVSAVNNTTQSATSSGVSVGLISVGASLATASSNTHTTALLDNGNNTAQATTGALSIVASGNDTNDASATAGSGGLLSGNAAYAHTDGTAVTTASLGSNLNLAGLDSLTLSATQATTYGGNANSELAAAVGASGANVANDIHDTTQATIGSSSVVDTKHDLSVLAKTKLETDLNNTGASGGAGGIVAGTAAGVKTTIGANNTVTVGSNNTLASGLDSNAATLGRIMMVAGTLGAALSDNATITSGGAVPIANASVDMEVSSGDTVAMGNNNSLLSYGRTDIGTYATFYNVAATASANTFGAAPVGLSDATANITATQSVNLGTGNDLTSYGEADIVAGKDVIGAMGTTLAPSAVAQSYVRGLIAIPHASATANTVSNSSLAIGSGSTITGGGDVAIGAVQGTNTITTDGTGHGYELGFIPVVQHSNNQSATGSATATVNGSVTAGAFDTIKVAIDASGNVSTDGSTAPVALIKDSSFNPTAYLNTLDGTDGQSYEGMDNAAVGGFIFGSLFAGGGNLYLYGSSVTGGGSLTANGAPSITINNASTYYMVLPELQTSFGSAGNVIVSGGASVGSLGGISVHQTPSDAQPLITVNSSHAADGTATPGIILGNVSNLGGSFTLNDAAGSLLERGTVSANSQTVTVPNGYVVIKPDASGIWYSGSNPTSNLASSWIGQFLSQVISSPDYAAAAIANSQYPGYVTNLVGPGTSGAQNDVLVLYGSCRPQNNNSGCGGIGPTGGTQEVLQWDMPVVPTVALSQSGKFSTAQLSSTSAFTGQAFVVKAKFIDIDGAINAGTPATWTVSTTPALTAWIATQNTNYKNNPSGPSQIALTASNSNGSTVSLADANGNVLLTLAGGTASQLIGAVYDVATGQLILNNVTATGGGTVDLQGKIVSTATGSINVNSGYGSVTVNNGTGVPLVVQNVFAGSGGTGIIKIEDQLANKTTWYVSTNGGPAQQYITAYGAADYTGTSAVGTVGAGTTYAPVTGSEFQWTASTNISRSVDYVDKVGYAMGAWGWADSSGAGTAGQHWTLGASGFIDPGAANSINLNGKDYLLALSGSFSGSVDSGVAYHGCNGSGHCNYGTTQTGTSANGTAYSLWEYIQPYQGTLTLTNTQRADLPIGINFITSSTSAVNIVSNSDVLLNGQITNQHGSTSITATNGGNIVQAADNGTIWTRSLDLTTTGGGSIGTVADPINARIAYGDTSTNTTDANGNSVSTPLNLGAANVVAHTDGGQIALDIDSGTSTQAINAVASGSYGYGNVTIRNTGSIVGIAGQAQDIVGAAINLTSTNGSVGSIANPLNIQTHTTTQYDGSITGGQLNVQANGDIGLKDSGGDVWVGTIASTIGDVTLDATNGGIYDARQLTAASTLSSAQATALWDKLHLTDGSAANATITAVQNSVNASYSQYWQLMQVGSVVNGTFVLNPSAIDLYWPLAALANNVSASDTTNKAALTQAYVASRYNGFVSDFTTYIGSDWSTTTAFAGRTSALNGYSFTLDTSSAEYAKLTANSTWTGGQLTYAINVAALAAPTNSSVGTVAPNISGRNLTLVAANGGVGRTDSPLTIDYSALKALYSQTSGSTANVLTDEQVRALGLANAPGDVVLKDAAGNTLLANDPDLANKLATLSVTQTMPLYITATGTVSGSSSTSTYLQANGDLKLGGLTTVGDTRLAATGSIEAAPGSNVNIPVVTTGGDLVLNSGSGHVSYGNGTANSAGDALAVQVGGKLLNASATTDLLIRQVTGDLTVGTGFANGLLSLQALNGSILGSLSTLSLQGKSIDLVATGDIGRRNGASSGAQEPLLVQVGDGGLLDANAGGEVNLESPTLALHVGTIQAGGQVTLAADNAAIDAQSLTSTGAGVSAISAGDGTYAHVQAQTAIGLNATTSLQASDLAAATGDITLNAATGLALGSADAQSGNIVANLVGVNGPAFTVLAGSTVQAANAVTLDSSGSFAMGTGSQVLGNTASVTTAGDMTLGLVTGTASTGQAVTLHSSGTLGGNGDSLNVVARNGGNVSLTAAGDIGSVALPLVVDVNSLDAQSAMGGIWIHGLNALDVSSIAAATDIGLGVDGALDVSTLTAGGNVAVQAGGDAHIATANVVGSSALGSNGTLTLDTFTGGNDVVVTAGNDLVIGTATLMAGALTASAGNDLTVTNALNVQAGSATLSSTAATDLASVTTAGDLGVNAGTSLTATTLMAGGDATLTAGTGMTLDQTATGGTLSATAGDDLNATSTTVGGATNINAGGSLGLSIFTGGSDVIANAGRDMTLGTGVVTSGSLVAHAGNDLSVSQSLDVQAGDATLSSIAATTLASVTTAGNLGVDAGTSIDATALSVGGMLALQSGTDTHVVLANAGGGSQLTAAGNLNLDTFTGGDDVLANAGGDIAIGTATLTGGSLTAHAGNDLAVNTSIDVQAGNATLSSIAATTLASVATAGNLGVDADTSLDATTLAIGGTLDTRSGTDTHVITATVAGTSTINAGGSLVLDTFSGGNNVAARAGHDITIGTGVLTGGSLTADAGNDLAVNTSLGIQAGDASLSSVAATSLASVTSSGDLGVHAGTLLDATTLMVGGNATLAAGTDMALGNTTVTGNLASNAGHDLVATQTNIVGDASVTTGHDTDLATLFVGGTLALQSGNDGHIATGTIGGSSTLHAGAALALDSITAGDDMLATAGSNLTIGTGVLTEGSITANAGNNLAVTRSLDIQAGHAALTSGAAMALASVHTANTLAATAGTDMQATTLQVGTDGTLTAGGNMTLDTVGTGGNLAMYAGLDMGFNRIAAGGHVLGQSYRGDIDGNTLTANDWIKLIAAGNIRVGHLTAGTDIGLQAGGNVDTQVMTAGNDVDVKAGGNVSMFSTKAGSAITVDAGGALKMNDATAGASMNMAASDIAFASLTAPVSITLLARAGDIDGQALTTRDGFLAATAGITLDAANIGNRINLQATDIAAHVKQTSTGQPLYSVLTGFNGGVARQITVDADAPQQWMIDRLAAVNAALATTASSLHIPDGHIGETMSLKTAQTSIWMDQQSATLLPVDVQLMQPTLNFQLYVDDKRVLSDAFVVRYSDTYQVQTPNYVITHDWMGPTFLGESATRYTGRTLEAHTSQADEEKRNDDRKAPAPSHVNDDPVAPALDSTAAVNLRAPE